uniref:Putative secreted peptide n=1 Tax=Anopheles braziliensis TaxID=58242 RepID=A0A2M3ZWK9_9DIPT
MLIIKFLSSGVAGTLFHRFSVASSCRAGTEVIGERHTHTHCQVLSIKPLARYVPWALSVDREIENLTPSDVGTSALFEFSSPS